MHENNLKTTSRCDIDAIVSELRLLRDKSLQRRPPKLPSRRALIDILEGFSAALFPNRLGSGELSDGSIDYFVGRRHRHSSGRQNRSELLHLRNIS
jgi:serine O-acetyltransferase